MANLGVCSIPECGKPACNRRGWCNAHYLRWARHGSHLGLRAMNGAALAFIERALAYDGTDCLDWPYSTTPGGYGVLRVRGRRTVASRYLCTLVHGEPPTPKHEAAHSCGRGGFGCMTKAHLSWKTRAGNQADRVVHATSNRGTRAAASKLEEADVLSIRALAGIVPQKELAARFGVAQPTVSEIIARRKWAWL